MDEATVSGDDLLAVRAAAMGIGLIALMITWLVTNRIAGVFWDPPTGPVLAMGLAVMSGLASTIIGFRRLITRSD